MLADPSDPPKQLVLVGVITGVTTVGCVIVTDDVAVHKLLSVIVTA